ncbi:MAG: CHAT domain-containing tetratricopeptide repeat protein [Bacteroidota bacterium]
MKSHVLAILFLFGFSHIIIAQDSTTIWLEKGYAHYMEGQYAAAITLLQKVISSSEADPLQVAQAYQIVGISYYDQSNYLQSAPHYARAYELYVQVGQHNRAASCGRTLGILYTQLGDFEKAIFIFQQAILQAQRPPVMPRQLALLWRELSYTYGYYDATDLAKEALKKAESVPHLELKDKIYITQLLAAQLVEEGQMEEAILKLETSLDLLMKEELYDPLFDTYSQLAGIHPNPLQARAYYQQALTLIPLVFESPNIREVSQLYLSLGSFFLEQKEYDQGLNAYQKALYHLLPFATDTIDLYHIPHDSLYYCENVFLQAFRGKAECLSKMGQKIAAIEHYMAMVKAQEQLSACNTYESSQRILLEDQRASLGHALALTTSDESQKDQALFFFEKSKAQIMNQLMRRLQSEQTILPDSLQEDLQERAELIADYHRLLAQEGESPKVRTQLDSVRFEQADYLVYLRESYPAYRQSAEELTYFSLPEIQKALRSDQLMIHYVMEGIPYALAISAEDSRMYQLDSLGSHDFALRDLLEKPSTLSTRAEIAAYATHAYALYQLLLAPILSDFPAAKSLILIPDGDLQRLPFEALLTEAADLTKLPPELQENFWKGRERVPEGGAAYVLYAYEVQYAFTAGLWIEARSPLDQPSGIMQVYYPTYTDLDSFGGHRIPILPSARPHATRVAEGFGQNGNLSSSSITFLEQADKAEWLHLAMHGFVDVEDDLGSALAFGGAGKQDPDLVVAADLYAMPPLTTRLVSLLACKSGDGKTVQGEGILSLGRTFRLRGARSVMMSLWDADARLGGELLEDMYTGIQEGMSPASALRAAKVHHLTLAKAAEAHPGNWSNYVLIGNGHQKEQANKRWLIWILFLLVSLMAIYFLKKKKKFG